MGLENRISTREAAEILSTDERQVRRYMQEGLLAGTLSGRTLIYDTEDVKTLRDKLLSEKQHSQYIKEMYAMAKTGVPQNLITRYYDINKPSVFYALEMYQFQRRNQLRKFDINPDIYDTLLLVTETAARLKIVDKHIIYSLVTDGELEAHNVEFKGETRYFIKLDSFRSYLGHYSDKILLRSNEVSNLVVKTIEELSRIAQRLNIGFKIKKDNPRSAYLFSNREVRVILDTIHR